MKKKELAIIKLLSGQENWITSFAMSALLNISVRSIKSYIRDINSENPNLIESSREGFLIKDKGRLTSLFAQQKVTAVPQNSQERKRYILRKLLLEAEQCNLDVLADELFISPVTLMNEIPKIKTELSDYDLTIRSRNSRISIEGLALNKKKLISKLIYEDSGNVFLSIQSMQRYFPNYDLAAVKHIAADALHTYQHFMDDFSILNLVLHIAVTMERKRVFSDSDPQAWEINLTPIAQNIASDIALKIKSGFGVSFSRSETNYFALLVMTRAFSNCINDINIAQLSELAGEDILQLVTKMHEKMKDAYNISITNSEFTVRFSLYLKNLLARLQHRVELTSLQTLDIKHSYPLIYDAAVFIANIVTQETGHVVPEIEISYIAHHLGALIDERSFSKNEIRAVLVNPQILLNSTDLASRLSDTFESSLVLIGIASSYEDLDLFSGYDMVITTLCGSDRAIGPCVQISAYLTNKDVLAVSKKIEDVLKARIKSKVESKLQLLFRKDLFYVDEDLRNQDCAIERLADVLKNNGYVDASFKEKLFQRERVSSSAYLNIAMPHPFEMCALSSAVAVSIHPNAILWNDRRVNIVFMLAINAHDNLFFKDIFSFITEVISEEKKLKTILETESFEQFIAALVSFAK